MGQLKWYKRDPGAALNGMMELSLEERGAYNTVLDLIYSRDGNLADDDRFIAGWLRVDVRIWKRIKSSLIERGKLFVSEGVIRNERADVEVLAALSRVTSAQDAGRASARSKAAKSAVVSNQSNNLGATDAQTDDPTPVSTNYNYNHKEKDSEDTHVSSGGGAPTVDLVKVIFDTGRTILSDAGYEEKQARSIIGRLRKQFGDPAVLIALSAFQSQLVKPEEPLEWISGSLRSQARQNGAGYGDKPVDRRNGFTRAADRRVGFGDDQPFAGSDRRYDDDELGSLRSLPSPGGAAGER